MRISDWSSDVCSSDLQRSSRRLDSIAGMPFTGMPSAQRGGIPVVGRYRDRQAGRCRGARARDAKEEHEMSTGLGIEQQWARVRGRLRDEVGEAAFRSWLKPLTLAEVDDGEVRIAVPTRFMRDWVMTHYADR